MNIRQRLLLALLIPFYLIWLGWVLVIELFKGFTDER